MLCKSLNKSIKGANLTQQTLFILATVYQDTLHYKSCKPTAFQQAANSSVSLQPKFTVYGIRHITFTNQ